MATFHPFEKLPTELRDRIWELAVPDVPRVVCPPQSRTLKLFQFQIRCRTIAKTNTIQINVDKVWVPSRFPSSPISDPARREAELSSPWTGQIRFCTNTIPSSLLLACKSSRKIMLKSHTGCIESQGVNIRFNPLNDTIFLCDEHFPDGLIPGLDYPKTRGNYSKTFADVKHLGLRAVRIDGWFGLLAKFPSLETLTLIVLDMTRDEFSRHKSSLLCLFTWEERSALAIRLDDWLDGERVIQEMSRPAREEFADYNASHDLEPLTFELSVKILGAKHSL
jgi:hypothetical protein